MNGEREVLGFVPGDKESRAAWDSFLDDLKRRMVESAELWISDGGPAVIGRVKSLWRSRQPIVPRPHRRFLTNGVLLWQKSIAPPAQCRCAIELRTYTAPFVYSL